MINKLQISANNFDLFTNIRFIDIFFELSINNFVSNFSRTCKIDITVRSWTIGQINRPIHDVKQSHAINTQS